MLYVDWSLLTSLVEGSLVSAFLQSSIIERLHLIDRGVHLRMHLSR